MGFNTHNMEWSLQGMNSQVVLHPSSQVESQVYPAANQTMFERAFLPNTALDPSGAEGI